MRSDEQVQKLNEAKVEALLLEAEQRRLARKNVTVFKRVIQKLISLARGLDLPRVLKRKGR